MGIVRVFTSEEKAEAKRAYERGANVEIVAEMLGSGTRTATRCLREAGTRLRPPGQRKRR